MENKYSDVTNWATFQPTDADGVLTKIEHLLRITSDNYRETGIAPVSRRGRPRKQTTTITSTSMNDDVGASSSAGRRRKGEEEEDKELLKQSANETFDAVTAQPPRLQGEMHSYQVEGLRWMVELFDTGVNGILADEMGLGKTIQTISLLAYLKDIRDVPGKHLIIVPKSTMGNWAREFGKFYPHFKIVSLQGDKDQRPPLLKQLPEAEIILTTYEMCLIEQTALKKYNFCYVILDEAHRIKNDNAKTTQMIRSFHSDHRLLITGTPINNNLDELWTLLNFLRPDLFQSNDEFRLLFDDQAMTQSVDKDTTSLSPQIPIDEEIDENALELLKDDDDQSASAMEEPATPAAEENAQSTVLSRLHRILRPFLLRRLKSEVAKSLPPKVEVKVYVKLTDLQRKQYKGLIQPDLDALNNKATNTAKPRLHNLVMQLRKCANHPYLFDGVEPEPIVNGPHLIKASGKLVVLDKLLEKLQRQSSRVLIFSQMSRMLDILDDYCSWKGLSFCRIDGDTDHATREQQIDDFNAPGSDKFLFLLSTRAGGVGINLFTADCVVLFDSDWNPQMDLQAMDRAHRIGQTKQVNVFRFVTEGTLEEKIIERALKKLALDALIIQKGRLERQKNKIGPSANEMQAMVRFGADQVFRLGSTDGDNENIDVDLLLEQCKIRSEEELKALQTEVQNFSLSNTQSSFNIRSLEGNSFEIIKNVKTFYIEPPSRNETSKQLQEQNFNTLLQQRMKGLQPVRPYRGLIQDYHLYLNTNEIQQLAEIDFNHREQLRVFKYEQRQRELLEKELSYKSKGCELNSTPPTDEQSRRLKILLSTGFTNWTKKNMESFFVASYIYGCHNIDAISLNVPGKSPEEVKAYHAAFVQRVDFAAGENFKTISIMVPDPEDPEAGPVVEVTQDSPISLKEAKYYISRARSLAAFVTRQKQFRDRLQYKITQAVETYQAIAKSQQTSSLSTTPQVHSFLDCFVLKYLPPSAKLEVITRQVAPFSKEWVEETLDLASHLPANIRRQSEQYHQAKALMKYYHGDLVDENASIAAIASAKSQAKKAAAAKKSAASSSTPTTSTKDTSPPKDLAIAELAEATILSEITTVQYMQQSLQCVARSGHQWTPRDDATLLYALRCCDIDLPQLLSASEEVKSVVSNTVGSLLTQTYSMEHVYYLLKRMPQNSFAIDWQVLSDSDILERIHYLVSVLECEAIKSLDQGEVISIDHETAPNSWYGSSAVKFLSGTSTSNDDSKSSASKKLSHTATTLMNDGDDDAEDSKPKSRKRLTGEEKEAIKAAKDAEKVAKDTEKAEKEAEKQRIKAEKEAEKQKALEEREHQRFEQAALRIQNREKRKAESQAINMDDPATQEDNEVIGRQQPQQPHEAKEEPKAQTQAEDPAQTQAEDPNAQTQEESKFQAEDPNAQTQEESKFQAEDPKVQAEEPKFQAEDPKVQAEEPNQAEQVSPVSTLPIVPTQDDVTFNDDATTEDDEPSTATAQ